MDKSQTTRYGRFKVVCELAHGAFGIVYVGATEDGSKVAIKVSTGGNASKSILELEIEINRFFASTARILHVKPTFPVILGYSAGPDPYMVTPLRGPSLACFQNCQPEFAASAAAALIAALQGFHILGMIHRDITMSNVVVVCQDPLRLELIDLAFCKSFKSENPITGQRVHYMPGKTKEMWGTATFASINAESFLIQSRRDDMEAAAYVAIWLRQSGRLPWGGGESVEERIRLKKSFSGEGIEPQYRFFLRTCQRLDFTEVPPYGEWISQFKGLPNPTKS